MDCKHGSGNGIADTCYYRKYPVGTSRCDVKKSTGHELSTWSIEVVNPHSGTVLAKIAKIARRERDPTRARARIWGHQPTKKPTRTAEGLPRSRP